MRSSKVLWTLLAVCFLLTPLAASAGTLDYEKYWTTTGSTGTLDETSEGKVFFERAKVQKGNTVTVAQKSSGADTTDTAVIRYNVTAVDGLFGFPDANMTVRFLDTGSSARVTASLIAVDVATGAESTLLTFDSNAFGVPVQNVYQRYDVCGRGVSFDFVKKVYYIEATLTNSSVISGSAAGIEAIQINSTYCP